MKKYIQHLLAVTAILMAGTTAEAANEGWAFEIAPYAWLAGLEGDVTINGQKTDFEKSSSDMLEYVDLAGSLFGTVRYNRWVVSAAVDYFDLSTDNLDTKDQPQGGELDTEMLIGEIAGGYQFNGLGKEHTLDVLLGVRYMNMENDLTVYPRPVILPTGSKGSSSTEVTDPMLLARYLWPIGESFSFNITAGIGGGGDSEMVYELFPDLRYQFGDHFNVRLGYRTVGWEIEGSKGNDLNIAMSGLVAGFGFMF